MDRESLNFVKVGDLLEITSGNSEFKFVETCRVLYTKKENGNMYVIKFEGRPPLEYDYNNGWRDVKSVKKI